MRDTDLNELRAGAITLPTDMAPPPTSEKLSVRHVSFRYGEKLAVDDVSFPIYANRVTALIGPSGCGKSTLLRVFNRMYELYPDQHASGEIFMDGENILGDDVELAWLRKRIGMVFQAPAPFPMSVYDNVAYGLRLFHDYNRRQLARAVESALRRAALWDEVKDNLGRSGLSLSGGQQQRLCIARAIAMRPEVVLLDEPCSALDPGATAKIENTIMEMKADFTVVIVTHNLQQAGRVSDFTGFMYLGKLIEFGTTEQMFTRPREAQTQHFVSGRFG
jgi:phosphate transport system ATP-binding protein